MSKPKRYTHVSQINHDIDQCHADSKRLLREAEQVEQEAKAFFKVAFGVMEKAAAVEDAEARKAMSMQAGELRESGKLKQIAANKLRITATNLVDKKARKLGAKKSEFETMPMPGLLPDGSVERKL